MTVRQAVWKDTVIAESDHTITVEGNHYFPPDSVTRGYLQPSDTHTRCYWKGTASYYDVVVDGQRNRDAAWYYPEPSAAAQEVRAYIAFWHGVRVRAVSTAGEAKREPAGSGGGGWLRRLLRT